MFFTSIHRLLQQQPVRIAWNTAACVIVAAPLLVVPHMASAQTDTDFEKPPLLKATDLVFVKLLKGKGFHVDDKVPTDGVMGIYTIKADAETFHGDAGTYQVRSCELLELHLSEIPAIVQLTEVSKTGTFVKSLGASAVRPLEAAGNMVMNPMEAVTGLPNGVGRLFDRVGTRASRLWNSPTDPNKIGGIPEERDWQVGHYEARTAVAQEGGRRV
jgi:hypothetical protein